MEKDKSMDEVAVGLEPPLSKATKAKLRLMQQRGLIPLFGRAKKSRLKYHITYEDDDG